MPVDPLIALPVPWIIVLNIVGWPVIQMGVSLAISRVPAARFRPDSWLFRERRWERGGDFYARWTAVRRWKQWLPDGASWIGGFAKKRLASRSPAYLNAFIPETCRGELAHWIMIAATPIFFLWNPLWADGVMCAYAIASNLPCVIAQRYARHRIRRSSLLTRPAICPATGRQ